MRDGQSSCLNLFDGEPEPVREDFGLLGLVVALEMTPLV